MSKVGNQTNSQDPQAVNSRVFVGNLNTFQCSKTDVERMFQRYGRLAGRFLLVKSHIRKLGSALAPDILEILSRLSHVRFLTTEDRLHLSGRAFQIIARDSVEAISKFTWNIILDNFVTLQIFHREMSLGL